VVQLQDAYHLFLFVSHTLPRFDKTSANKAALVLAQDPEPPQIQQLTWPNEPVTIDSLLNTYNIETKAAARWPGATMYLVQSQSRSGKTTDIVEGQAFKLFLATGLD